MNSEKINLFLKELHFHLTEELLPFWLNRMKDKTHGGFITHFDREGNDTGENEKSLIAQSRSLYSLSSAARHGYEVDKCTRYAGFGLDFLIRYLWDERNGGFYWMVDRQGNILADDKVLYGQSFAIYSLSEYTLATGDPKGLFYAEKLFDLIWENCYDPEFGGYYEMFDARWKLAGPGAAGGDRKTLDVHMHLMEAFTNLYACSREQKHREALLAVIDLLIEKIIHPRHKTGIPQFTPDWKVAPQIKFNIIWGWDRYTEGGQKPNAEDNTAYGHNAEFAWLLIHALKVMDLPVKEHDGMLKIIFDHTVNHGIDREYGGVYVEGPHSGGVYDMEKEFWQQAEVMIGMLDAFIYFRDPAYLDAYENVHRFVFDKMINHSIGEWWPLLTREGIPVWTHMSHSWKVNYHTIRCMIQCIERMKILAQE
ncbi:MAG: AGE family epimerase/isomerase [Cyclobacteriaceae bacterium]|nr:AGE family epimerase/isomerase [Cyclobacteriaceae bacterium]